MTKKTMAWKQAKCENCVHFKAGKYERCGYWNVRLIEPLSEGFTACDENRRSEVMAELNWCVYFMRRDEDDRRR